MNTFKMPLFIATCLIGAGCSQSVPRELADARTAYARAANGPAAQQNPADLHTAHEALEEAENSFKEDGNTTNTRDRAYVAARKARTAEVLASAASAKQEAAKWSMHSENLEDQALKSAKEQLADERTKRQDAERRAEAAFADLARSAQVEKQSRGTVITLPGNVLFESGKAALLPSAETKLAQVADALVTSSPDSTMVVEGHTDSQGKDAYNQTLSQNRADVVRSYLVQRGVAADRIVAKGMGEASPVADNKSAEGRATNRRVEIIVQDSAGDASANSGASGSTTPSSGVTKTPTD